MANEGAKVKKQANDKVATDTIIPAAVEEEILMQFINARQTTEQKLVNITRNRGGGVTIRHVDA